MGDWNNLPGDLVRSIEEVIVCYIDKVRFRSVCAWWHSSTCDLPKLPNLRAKQLPWLLYDHNRDDDRDEEICKDASHGFMNINQDTYHMYIPEARGKMFKGSSYGWVAVVDDTDAAAPDISLLNPFTRSKIALPPRNKFPDVKTYRPSKVGEEYGLVSTRLDRKIDYHDAPRVTRRIWKIILSAPPSEKDCVAVAIYGGQDLAYCEISRNKKWNELDNRFRFSDVIFSKGKLHAVTTTGELLVFESLRSNGVQIACQISKYTLYLYLVESCGGEKLLMVERDSICQPRDGFTEIDYMPWKSTGFKVYLLDKKNQKWIILKSIGNNMLFLGINGSLSFSSYYFPGYKGNCIYFTDDHVHRQWKGKVGGQDIGVFDLTDKSIKPLPGFKTDPYRIWPPPIWVTPGQSLGA